MAGVAGVVPPALDSNAKLTCLHKKTEHQAARTIFGCVKSIQRSRGCQRNSPEYSNQIEVFHNRVYTEAILMAQIAGIEETKPRIASRQRYRPNIHAQSCTDYSWPPEGNFEWYGRGRQDRTHKLFIKIKTRRLT